MGNRTHTSCLLFEGTPHDDCGSIHWSVAAQPVGSIQNALCRGLNKVMPSPEAGPPTSRLLSELMERDGFMISSPMFRLAHTLQLSLRGSIHLGQHSTNQVNQKQLRRRPKTVESHSYIPAVLPLSQLEWYGIMWDIFRCDRECPAFAHSNWKLNPLKQTSNSKTHALMCCDTNIATAKSSRRQGS